MDTQRLILFLVFSFSLLLLWEAWQKESHPPVVAGAGQSVAPVPSPGAPAKSAESGPSLPSVPQAPQSPQGAQTAPATGERVTVETDLMRAQIELNGGDISYLELLEHRDTGDTSKPVVLFGPEHRYAAESGFIGQGLPNHRTTYTSAQKQFTLKPGQDTLEVRLEAPGPDGVKAVKTLRFKRGSYAIEMGQQIENQSAAPVTAYAYYQLVRDGNSPADSNRMASTYTGAAVYSEKDKFKKVSFSDIDKGKAPYEKNAEDGWVAMIQHYFVAAIIPSDHKPRENYTRKLAEDYYAVGVIEPVGVVKPGTSAGASAQLYAGPQEQSILKAIAPGLDLVVDYGWLTIIAAPLFWVLEMFYRWSGNWGIAIILLTVLIKLIFFPLSAASYKSMARMKLVAPRLTKLRETYANDRMKQNQAMMELYKSEKINPLGGCLPIAVQIPVFIALYWVLLAAVELRHAPFYGWIHDLSAADPWYVLPALMMGSMLLQTKMNPKPPDPVQAKVMMIMPFAFGVMFFFFPAGLVLYWVVNNVLSILQQWQINRMFTAPKAPKR